LLLLCRCFCLFCCHPSAEREDLLLHLRFCVHGWVCNCLSAVVHLAIPSPLCRSYTRSLPLWHRATNKSASARSATHQAPSAAPTRAKRNSPTPIGCSAPPICAHRAQSATSRIKTTTAASPPASLINKTRNTPNWSRCGSPPHIAAPAPAASSSTQSKSGP